MVHFNLAIRRFNKRKRSVVAVEPTTTATVAATNPYCFATKAGDMIFCDDGNSCSLMRHNTTTTTLRPEKSNKKKGVIFSFSARKLLLSGRRRKQQHSNKNTDRLELIQLRILCQQQNKELREARESNIALQHDNDCLLEDNRCLTEENVALLHKCNRLTDEKKSLLLRAQDSLRMSHFFYHPKAPCADQFNHIGPVQHGIVEVPGKQVGNYDIDKLLGEGSFGKVWSGRASDTREQVAIKAVDKTEFRSSKELIQLDLECSILRQHSHHPNVIGLHSVMHARDRFYLVMEKAEASLADYSDQKKLQPNFMQQV